MVDNQRRTLLKSLGITATVGLSGCTQLLREDTQNEPETSPTPEPTPEQTPEPTKNQTETETPEPDIPDSYRADRKRTSSQDAEIENLGNYSTEHEWDNILTNTQELRETQERALDQEAYSPLVNQIMNGEDFSTGTYSFPNEDNFFDQDAVKNEDDFEKIVRWYLPAIMHHDRENYGNAPSSRNYRFAATLETLINEHHPDEETKATSIKALPAHGIFGIQDTKDEEFYMVDTTSSPQYDGAVGRIGDFNTSNFDPEQELSRQNLWDPFHQFQPGPTESIGYPSKSQRSIEALARFVTKGNELTIEEGDPRGHIFITDEWLDDAYNILRNGGSIQPIVEPLEEMIYEQRTDGTDNTIGIYGNLDDTRIAVNSRDENYDGAVGKIYDEVIGNPEPQNIDDIETILETA